ncbi:MAG TPA: alanine--tRNA ligase [Nitrospiraceae bacterium]|nr:alanine--tRNA ligase [Nitrospiraceae bacterium]
MKANELRKLFLDYFAERGHKVVPSSPLVPRNDPSLLFTNAGMVQFKGVFLGEEQRDYQRAVTTQKCIRAGGKHNDLENVGHTARHHTFFEMLGNFSFGDYFKKEAIAYAWEFLTEKIKLPPERLWITVFREDDEAFELWKKVAKVSPERIVRMDEKDNFWQMGDTGPCGPCSEILIDQGPELSCGKPDCAVGCECDRYLEIWNLVFMQYDRDASGTMTPLPSPSIDTGMGLERLTAVVQGVKSNYETDLFQPIIQNISSLAGVPYGSDQQADISYQVIADHLRSITFLLSDGILPSNEGRGYVLRRIIRRASRYGKLIGIDKPFLYGLTAVVVDEMRDAFPELVDSREHVAKVTLLEEERFATTLDSGLALLNETVAKLKGRGSKSIPGDILFKLYDTYGFPLDLVADMARDMNLQLDEAGYQRAMEEQRNKARAAWAGSGEEKVKPVYSTVAGKVPNTVFTGYDTLEDDGEILAIIRGDTVAPEVGAGDEAEIVLHRTPFYAESGGQVGDRGELLGEGAKFSVEDTAKPFGDLVVHKGRVKRGVFREGDAVLAKVEAARRSDTVRHHTVTHILHATLRSVLGDHVKQAGSLVAPDRLRFDFTHYAPVSPRERERIEEMVNQRIIENHPLETKIMDVDQAMASGAMALFDEKYGDSVRVVTVQDVSRELCGGTHARASGDIGLFKIISEAGIAAGVRRIEAVAGKHAYQAFKREEQDMLEVARILKASDLDIVPRVERLVSQVKGLEKENDQFKSKMRSSQAGDVVSEAKSVDGVKVLAKRVDGMTPKDLRDFGDKLRDRLGSGILAIGTVKDDKVNLIVMVTKDLTKRFHAGQIIKELSALLGGSGGGKPDLAQSGGKDPGKLDEALKRLYTVIKRVTGNSAAEG